MFWMFITRFHGKQEQDLPYHVRDLDFRVYKRGRQQLMRLVFEYVVKNMPHRLSSVTNAAGWYWL